MRFPHVALASLVVLVAGCTNPTADGPVTFQDVHGLAVDPHDPQVVYVATHYGLFKGVDASAWSKVSTDTMDLMGFTMHPTEPNVMYASGHPSRPSRDYNSLGIIKSVDGEKSWTTVALKNQVDFHAMTISLAEPSKVWGYYYRDNNMYESRDAGLTWNKFAPQAAPPQVNSIAGHATNNQTLYAGSNDGVWFSLDGGLAWAKVEGNPPAGPAGAVATSTASPGILWAYFPSAGVAHSTDGGTTWNATEAIAFGANDGPSVIAVDPSNPQTVYVATGRGTVHRSTNEGQSWTQIQPVPA